MLSPNEMLTLVGFDVDVLEGWSSDHREVFEYAMGLVAAAFNQNLKHIKKLDSLKVELTEAVILAMHEFNSLGLAPTVGSKACRGVLVRVCEDAGFRFPPEIKPEVEN